MPKDGVDWKAEEEYLKDIGYFDQPVPSVAQVVKSFRTYADELERNVRTRLQAAGHTQATVIVTIEVTVQKQNVGGAFRETLHVTGETRSGADGSRRTATSTVKRSVLQQIPLRKSVRDGLRWLTVLGILAAATAGIVTNDPRLFWCGTGAGVGLMLMLSGFTRVKPKTESDG